MDSHLYCKNGIYLLHYGLGDKIFYTNKFNYVIILHYRDANISFNNYGDASLGTRRNTLPKLINTLKLIKVDYIKTE